MSGGYRIHEFAALAGVTVRALHHYDRLGLLKPQRTGSGYRVYADADLERLEQIVALKFIGVPLRAIRGLLERGSPAIADALRLQREALDEKRRQIDRATAAITAAERAMAQSTATTSSILSRLIEAITMEQNTEILRQYFGEAAWTEWKSRRALKAPDEWQALYHDIAAALGDDIRSPRARALAGRWMALVDLEAEGDAAIRTGLIRAWVAGHGLPTLLVREEDDEVVSRATRFVADVLWAQRDDELRARPPDAAPHKASESQMALWSRAEALVGTDPAGPAARALVADWDAWLMREANGDAETLRMMRLTVARRKAWPDGMRRYVASLVGATPERWEEVADWLDRARDAHEAR